VRKEEREMGQGNAAAEDRTYVSDHENGSWRAAEVENKFTLISCGRRFFSFEAPTNF
jgi:hypothetical protein